jgi:hypothetical protein
MSLIEPPLGFEIVCLSLQLLDFEVRDCIMQTHDRKFRSNVFSALRKRAGGTVAVRRQAQAGGFVKLPVIEGCGCLQTQTSCLCLQTNLRFTPKIFPDLSLMFRGTVLILPVCVMILDDRETSPGVPS